MLIEFSVENFKSINSLQKLSMVATSLSGHEEDNIIDSEFLKSAVLYGANASGKSNLIKALSNMTNNIEKSVQFSIENDSPFQVVPFLMDEKSSKKPTFFEIVVLVDGLEYRYNYSVLGSEILEENLFFTPKSREALLFSRRKNIYSFGTYFDKDSKELQKMTNSNSLFVTVLAQFNNPHAKSFVSEIQNIKVISGLETRFYERQTIQKLDTDIRFKDKLADILREADTKIIDLSAEKIQTNNNFPEELPNHIRESLLNAKELFSVHKVKTLNNEYVYKKFPFKSFESDGTKKLFGIAGPIISTLETGGTLIVDELDAKLHALLTRYIVRLFNSSLNNPNNAQLIFATHDTKFLNERFFRRDQIWFTEKNNENSTEIYSLSDLKDDSGNTIRKKHSYEAYYLQGKYGGIPFID